jgi:hypothetical protein
MGALYRHQILGVMPHMLGAMVVAILALVVSMTLIQHFGDQPQLKSSATGLITVVLAQVCLGIAAFLMLLLGGEIRQRSCGSRRGTYALGVSPSPPASSLECRRTGI